MVATICKIIDFPAAHANNHHGGHCSRVHGHTWTLEIYCKGKLVQDPKSPAYGMVCDFSELKRVYRQYVEPKVEHQNLNDTLDLPEYTTEHIAAWIFEVLHSHLPQVSKIRLWEGKSSFAEITNGDSMR